MIQYGQTKRDLGGHIVLSGLFSNSSNNENTTSQASSSIVVKFE